MLEEARFTGYTLDEGYAEFALADERFCFPMPELIPTRRPGADLFPSILL